MSTEVGLRRRIDLGDGKRLRDIHDELDGFARHAEKLANQLGAELKPEPKDRAPAPRPGAVVTR